MKLCVFMLPLSFWQHDHSLLWEHKKLTSRRTLWVIMVRSLIRINSHTPTDPVRTLSAELQRHSQTGSPNISLCRAFTAINRSAASADGRFKPDYCPTNQNLSCFIPSFCFHTPSWMHLCAIMLTTLWLHVMESDSFLACLHMCRLFSVFDLKLARLSELYSIKKCQAFLQPQVCFHSEPKTTNENLRKFMLT